VAGTHSETPQGIATFHRAGSQTPQKTAQVICQRSSTDGSHIATGFLDKLLQRLLGAGRTEEIWASCATCTAQQRCTANQSVQVLRDPSERGVRVREQLAQALQAVHQRGEVHITARELRAALSYIFFGLHLCEDLHAEPDLRPPGYWDRAFNPLSESRQGELLRALANFDPALETHPRIDREVMHGVAVPAGMQRRTVLASERRRAYFEWPAGRIEQVGLTADALTLAAGVHLKAFRDFPLLSEAQRQELCVRLCQGIARLEDLPALVLNRGEVVPLKLSPRTPVETEFWVEKPLNRFHLEQETLPQVAGLESLHSHLVLTYRYQNGSKVEQLRINSALFHLLLELQLGYQIADAYSDDTFANLSIFKQRLAQEEEAVIYAWTPTEEESVFRVEAELDSGVRKIRLSNVKGA